MLPPGVTGVPTSTFIVAVANNYVGLTQLETVVADVTNPFGFPISQGIVTFQVNGQSVTAPVINGVAVVTIATPVLDFNLMLNLVFGHPLTAAFTDSSGLFAPSGAGTTVPGILVDFFFFLLAQESRLTQLQL